MEGFTGFPSWESWLRHVGAANPEKSRGLKINNSAAVLQAAAEGHGVALARSVMAIDDVASGLLVRLFPEISFPSPLAYYTVYRDECATLPRIAAFKDWLVEQVEPL